jgi:tetratricopeptide (TPR) repeat protein
MGSPSVSPMIKPLIPLAYVGPPQNIGEMLQRAVALQQQGQLREAEKLYSRVLKAVPDQFDALNLLGTVKVQRGQAGEAYRLISAALKVNPQVPDAWVNLGIALHALKRDAEALESFDRALALRPGDAGALDHRGNVLLTMGRFQEALAAFDQALSLGLGHPQVRLNRGLALAALQRPQEALAEFDAVLALIPAHPAAHHNRGIALFDLGRYTEAVAAYDRALAAAPDHAKALNNRGLALQALARPSDALASYRGAIDLQKDYADAHFNQSLTLLTIGDFQRGFQEYEWRWRRSGMSSSPTLPRERGRGVRGGGRPLWLGEYPLQRKTILLQAEQGLGDTIQFVRYVPLLRNAGAKVVLEVQQELKPLLAQMAECVVARGEELPAFDVHCPVGSLPLAFKTEPATIPADIPYLAADQARIAKWRARLG